MKMNKVIVGMTAAIGLASANVMALPLADYNAAGSPAGGTLRTFVSGASAQDQGLEGWFRLQCTAGTLDIYRDGANQRMFFCRVNAPVGVNGTGVPGFPVPPALGQKVAFFKSSVGGSGNGVQPAAVNLGNRATATNTSAPAPALGFLNPANLAGCTNVAVPANGPLPAYTDHVCTPGALQNRHSDAGISDVEPALFGASPAEIARFGTNVFSQNAVVWGIPVTRNLRNALQQAQGLVVNSEDETNMPTLSRQQVTSVFVGQLANWDTDLVVPVGPNAGMGLAAAATTAPTSTDVFLCRRVATSGTQASYEVNFLRQRCVSGAPAMLSAANPNVMEGSGTSNVVSCLRNHNAAGRWALGIFSTENQEMTGNPPADNGWRFVKVDGRAPTLLNVVKGGYPYFSEQTIQWQAPFVRDVNSVEPRTAEVNLKNQLFTNLRTEVGNPTIVRTLNLEFNHLWGQSGLLALASNGHATAATPYTAALVTATPVSSQGKSYVTGSPNNCLEPALTSTQHAGAL